jgi:hypothetical protein
MVFVTRRGARRTDCGCGGALVSTTPRPATDEPVRGAIAPPWINSLSGIERMRLYARRVLPATPFARLTGFGIGHVSTGTLTGTLKASGHLVYPPAYSLAPLSTQALFAFASTAVDSRRRSYRRAGGPERDLRVADGARPCRRFRDSFHGAREAEAQRCRRRIRPLRGGGLTDASGRIEP